MNFWDWVVHFSAHVEELVVAASASLWAYFWIFVVSMIDGFFPIVPSETIVITMATIGWKEGAPWLPAVWLAAAAGAWCGDQIAVHPRIEDSHPFAPNLPRAARSSTLDWAEHALSTAARVHHRGALHPFWPARGRPLRRSAWLQAAAS